MGEPYKRMVSRYGIIGTVTGTEIRYGLNGWHPHKHILFITEKKIDDAFTMWAKDRWINCLNKFNACASMERGLNIIQQLDRDAKTYITKLLDTDTMQTKEIVKWSLADELTQGNKKVYSSTSRHAFQLLDGDRSGDHELFKEYAKATKGFHSLDWSKGLKQLLGVNDITDKDLAEEEEEGDSIIYFMDGYTWLRILKCGLRYEVLKQAELGGNKAILLLFQNHGII